MGAMVRYKRESGQDVSEMGDQDITAMVLFIYCCVASACKADGQTLELSFDDFADQMEPDDLQQALVCIAQEKKTPLNAAVAAT